MYPAQLSRRYPRDCFVSITPGCKQKELKLSCNGYTLRNIIVYIEDRVNNNFNTILNYFLMQILFPN